MNQCFRQSRPNLYKAALSAFVVAGVVTVVSACGSSASAPVARATQAPTPSPTPTIDPQVAVFHEYVTVLNPHLRKEAQAAADLQAGCDGSHTDSFCRSKVQALIDEVNAFLADLATVAAPTCLASVDPSIKNGLVNIRDGAVQLVAGIDAKSSSQQSGGIALLNQGVGGFSAAKKSLSSEISPGGRCDLEFRSPTP